MKEDQNINQSVNYIIEVLIRLALLFLLFAWCFKILLPFTSIMMWAVIFALAAAPSFNSLRKKLRGSTKWTLVLFTIICLSFIVIPSALLIESMVTGLKQIKVLFDRGDLNIPSPPAKIADWPLIGHSLYDLWKLTSESFETVILKYKDQLIVLGKLLFSEALIIGNSLFQIIVATVIAGFLLAAHGTDTFVRKFFYKLLGNRSDEIIDLFDKTVRNVVKGVIGVALIQSILTGIGFWLAGVPYAGLWSLLVLILAILQLPATFVVLPVVIYLFSTMSFLPAALWTAYLFVAGLSDNFLRPMLLGKGAPVPIIVIFVGVIGGFMYSGFTGLFTGAIVISLGYKFFMTWINESGENSKEEA